MTDHDRGTIALILAGAFIVATIVGCVGRAEAVKNYFMTNQEAPV